MSCLHGPDAPSLSWPLQAASRSRSPALLPPVPVAAAAPLPLASRAHPSLVLLLPPGRLPSCPSLLWSRCPAAARGDLLTCPRRGKGEPPDRQAETGAAWPPCAEQAAQDGFFLECGASLAWHEAWALPASCRPAHRWGVTPFLLSPPSSPRRPPCRGCPPRSWAQGHCSPDTSRAPPPGFPDPRVQEDLLPHLPPSCSPRPQAPWAAIPGVPGPIPEPPHTSGPGRSPSAGWGPICTLPTASHSESHRPGSQSWAPPSPSFPTVGTRCPHPSPL